MAEPNQGDAAVAGPAPGGVPETILPVHPLTRYLKVHLEVTGGVLRWEVPRALLGVVPIGVHLVRAPLGEIRSLRVRLAVRPLDLLLGLAGIALPLAFGLGWAATPLVALGVWVALVSFGPVLRLVARSGAKHRAGACFGHRFDLELYAAAVNDLLGGPHPGAQGGPAA